MKAVWNLLKAPRREYYLQLLPRLMATHPLKSLLVLQGKMESVIEAKDLITNERGPAGELKQIASLKLLLRGIKVISQQDPQQSKHIHRLAEYIR